MSGEADELAVSCSEERDEGEAVRVNGRSLERKTRCFALQRRICEGRIDGSGMRRNAEVHSNIRSASIVLVFLISIPFFRCFSSNEGDSSSENLGGLRWRFGDSRVSCVYLGWLDFG